MTGPHTCLCRRNVRRPPCQTMEQSAAEHSPSPRRPAGPGPRSTARPARWSAGGDRENGTLHRLHGTPFSPAVNDHPRSLKKVLGSPSRPGQYQERPFSAKGHPAAHALLPGGQRAAPDRPSPDHPSGGRSRRGGPGFASCPVVLAAVSTLRPRPKFQGIGRLGLCCH